MTPDQKLVDDARSRLASYIRSRGMRCTPERLAILEKAYSTPEHFQADMLYDAMELEGYHVSRSTVYKTLRLLEEAGLLAVHRFADQPEQYERADTAESVSHLHLVCNECGRVRPAREPELLSRLLQRQYSTFQTSAVAVYVYGLCSRCQKRLRRAAREAQQAKEKKQN